MLSPHPANAGGFEASGIGTRALSMGGAFAGLADDWSAGFWNPAGFAFMKGTGFGQSVDLISLRAMDGNSIANPLPPLGRSNIEQGDPFFQLGGEPTRFNVTDTTIQAALPSAAGYKVWGPWSFSAGVFAPLGYAFTLNDNTVPGIQASFKSQGYVLEYNLSLAYRWNERWALGFGGNVLDARVLREASKQTATYTFNSSADGRGQALQGVVGLMGRPFSKFSLGMVYKMGTDVALKGTSTVIDTQFPVATPGGTLNNESSGVTSTVRIPATYDVGVAFFPTTSLTLTADWHGSDWRPESTDVQFDQPGLILQSQDFNAGWRFTNMARVGGEYSWSFRADRQAFLRWGYTWDPYAVPDSGVSVTNFVDVSRQVFTTGLGWRMGDWEPNIGFAYGFGSRTIDGVEYKKGDRLLSVGLEYRI